MIRPEGFVVVEAVKNEDDGNDATREEALSSHCNINCSSSIERTITAKRSTTFINHSTQPHHRLDQRIEVGLRAAEVGDGDTQAIATVQRRI